MLSELGFVQYSYRQAEVDAFFVVLYHSKDPLTQVIFREHGLKTVPYICTSHQETKRDPEADFYRTEDKWFIKAEDVHEAQV